MTLTGSAKVGDVVSSVCTISDHFGSARQRPHRWEAATKVLGSTPSFWLGRRGQVVPFLAFPLLTCPEVSATTYILARKTASGKIEALAVGRVEHAASSLNLAALRHHAASIGAQYVHVLIRPADARQRRRIERDLKTSATAIQPASNDD